MVARDFSRRAQLQMWVITNFLSIDSLDNDGSKINCFEVQNHA